ncbi:MAG: glutaredoxin family protein [Betaproteobacteria bacterium]|nr:glutaredoxin family protein [Betaproteobacteria bacterium]
MRKYILTVAILFLSAVHAQQLYRWVDKDGRVTYSQGPPPAGAAKNVQSKSARSSAVDAPPLPYDAQVAMKNFPVTLYVSPDCGTPCDDGRAMLQKRGIPFREVSAFTQGVPDQIKSMTGKTQVPVLRVGSRALSGFQPVLWKAEIDDAGYPASIPAQRPANPGAVNARGTSEIRLYTNSQCGEACRNARDLLNARKIAFKDIPVETNEALDDLKKYSESGSVPVLVLGSVVLRGFDATNYQAALDNAGYPRAAQPTR